MATRRKSSRKPAAARKARRPAPRKAARARRIAAAPAERRAAPIVDRSVRPIIRMAAGWSTLRVVWRPAIAMATLPYRVSRVYRWAEAEQARSASV